MKYISLYTKFILLKTITILFIHLVISSGRSIKLLWSHIAADFQISLVY